MIALLQLARSQGVRIRASAHPRGYRRNYRGPDALPELVWTSDASAPIPRGLEYLLTGGSVYGRARVADAMAASLLGARVVHCSPHTFVRLETAS